MASQPASYPFVRSRFSGQGTSISVRVQGEAKVLGYGHKYRKLRVAKQGSGGSGDKNVWRASLCVSLWVGVLGEACWTKLIIVLSRKQGANKRQTK